MILRIMHNGFVVPKSELMTEMQLFLTIICISSIFRIFQLNRKKDLRKCKKYTFMQTNQHLTIIRTRTKLGHHNNDGLYTTSHS